MRHLAPVAAQLLGMSLPSPAQAWDWRPPPGDPVIDLSAIDRLSERHALIALAGLRHTVANLPLDTDLTGLDLGLTFLGAMLFDTNRDPLMAPLRALRLEALSIMREARGDDDYDTFQQAHRALAHLQRFDPDNAALGEVGDLPARAPRRDEG